MHQFRKKCQKMTRKAHQSQPLGCKPKFQSVKSIRTGYWKSVPISLSTLCAMHTDPCTGRTLVISARSCLDLRDELTNTMKLVNATCDCPIWQGFILKHVLFWRLMIGATFVVNRKNKESLKFAQSADGLIAFKTRLAKPSRNPKCLAIQMSVCAWTV